MNRVEYADALHRHVSTFFEGHTATSHAFDKGPIQKVVPGFHALEIGEGPRADHVTYVSVGAGFAAGHSRLEFVATALTPESRHVELLAMATHYHLTGEGLAEGHTFPLGEPWLPGSTLDHMLVSLPYPYGSALEEFVLGEDRIQLLWLLPITKAERDHKAAHGADALEALFDAAGLRFWDPLRRSVV